jgi:polyisoprenoid-binding protein YceI
MFARNTRDRSARKRHWWRWIVAGIAALLVVLVLGAIAFIKLQAVPAALSLPLGAASAPSGPLGGTWTAGAGSAAGFRVRESAFGVSNAVVGRTSAVTGSVTIAGDTITSATFRIKLDAITVGGKAEPQVGTSLDTRAYPIATISLIRPVTLMSGFASGSTVHVTVTARLTMNGTTRPVAVTLAARRSGPALQAAGTIPVEFSGWGIKEPAGFGFLAYLADHGTAEFLLVLYRR